MNYYIRPPYPNELYHHGIKGQKWGVRRFEDDSGHLTAAGKERYAKYLDASERKLWRKTSKFEKHMAQRESKALKTLEKKTKKANKAKESSSERKKARREKARKKAEAVVKDIQNMSDTYYSMSTSKQAAINKGYSRIMRELHRDYYYYDRPISSSRRAANDQLDMIDEMLRK